MFWKKHLDPRQAYQWIHWSHVNNATLLKQNKRLENPLQRDGYKRAELHAATQQAVMDYLQHGTVHPSPNFAIWRDYWCWWAVLMEYAYHVDYARGSGDHTLFHRLQKQLRISRDIALGVDTEEMDLPVWGKPKVPGLEWFEDKAS